MTFDMEKKQKKQQENLGRLGHRKTLLMARLVHQQRWWRFYEQVRNGAYKRHHGPNDSLVEAESRAREKTQHIQQVCLPPSRTPPPPPECCRVFLIFFFLT